MPNILAARGQRITAEGRRLNDSQGRGLVIDADQIDETPTDAKTPPCYWAAFVLSGDWR